MLVVLLGTVLSLGNTVAGSTFNLTVPHSPIPVQLGSSATLTCQLNPPLNAAPFQVRWYRNNDVDNPVLLYENQQIQETSVDPHYKGRASLIGDLEKGDVSLKLENLTLVDRGEYTCFVKSAAWYERASVSLSMKVVGSIPVLSYTEVGKDQLNVTCVSDGWSSQPKLVWRDRRGGEINDNEVCEYTTDADNLLSVSSWLLVPPSNSEWISCSVYLSDQEMRESKMLPQITITHAVTPPNWSGEWRAAFITLLNLVLLEFSLLFLLNRTGYINIGKQTQTGSHDKSPECVGEEKTPLQPPKMTADQGITEQKVQTAEKEKNTVPAGKPEQKVQTAEKGTNTVPAVINNSSTMTDAQIVKIPELDTVKGSAVQLTLDTGSAPIFLTVGNNGKSVTCSDPNNQAAQGDHHPHVLCKERLSSHQHCWEVAGYTGPFSSKPQLSKRQLWYAGVCSAAAAASKVKHPLTAENGFWVLHYQKGNGYFVKTEPTTPVPVAKEFNTLGMFLDCDKHTLSFYDASEKQHLCTLYNIPPLQKLVPLICPGIKDKDCMYVSK